MLNGNCQAPRGPADRLGLTALELSMPAPGDVANGVCRVPASGMFAAGPFDVLSFVDGDTVVALATLAADRLTARRAMRVAPTIAPRHE